MSKDVLFFGTAPDWKIWGTLFIGSWGLAKLPDFYTRLHGPTKASTLGVGCTLIGSLLTFSYQQDGISVQEALVTIFLFATAPVSAHMMGKAALRRRLPGVAGTRHLPDEGPDSQTLSQERDSSQSRGFGR